MLALAGGPGVAVVPNSAHTAGAYAREAGGSAGGGAGARIGRVVYPPVDLKRFAAAAAAAAARRGGRPREKRAVTTGRFSPEKRHEAAVRIMRAAGGGGGARSGTPGNSSTWTAWRGSGAWRRRACIST